MIDFLIVILCPNGDKNMLQVKLGPCCLLDRVQCLVIENQLPSTLDQKLVVGQCNLWRWRPQLYPLPIPSIFFQLLAIGNVIQFFPFKIGFDVKKNSIEKSSWVTWVPYPHKDPTTILKFELHK
jgi:hypothetical protein